MRSTSRIRIVAIATLLIGLSFSACGIIERRAEVRQWIGRPASELVRQRGNPDRVDPGPDGGRVFVYEWTTESTHQVPGKKWREPTGAVRWTEPRTETLYHRERQSFKVDKNGTIVDASWPAW